LHQYDPADVAGLDRSQAEAETARYINELTELQELLYAVAQRSVLVILQGRDTSGKDGAIRHVLGALNPQGCSVVSYKVPSAEELAHDFLWRVHAHTPRLGHINVFNRSHYEDVLVVRVHQLVPESVWRTRYDHINAFERLLADAGTIVVKLYLHISKEEQEERLLKRETDPLKAWKLSARDWQEREHWDDYTAAYEDALNLCSTTYAPWYIVPADRKWFRNLAVAQALRDALEPYRISWLELLDDLSREGKEELAAYRRNNKRKE
jgi:PPK2 family polyphosphate:nucleotide phosphotransferase